MPRTTAEDRMRARQAATRRYRKLGYEVIANPAGEQLPAFLRRFSPDLVAMRDDDHVVIEIKNREELKGANEFVALAIAVEQHKGWRLELIHLESRRQPVVGMDADALDRLAARTIEVRDAGLQDAALIYALSVLEELIRDIGAQHGVTGAHLSARAIVRQLAFQGVVGEDAVEVLDRAWQQRDRILHGGTADVRGDASAVTELIATCREMQTAMQLEAA